MNTGAPWLRPPASPVSRSVARTTMTEVPMPAVSRSPRRLYCCCVNTGASSLTSSTYTITCGAGCESGGQGREVQGEAPEAGSLVSALPGQLRAAPEGHRVLPLPQALAPGRCSNMAGVGINLISPSALPLALWGL